MNDQSQLITYIFVFLNWVFGINSDLKIPIYLQPNVVGLRYFKLWILLYQIIKGLNPQVVEILNDQNQVILFK